jgi:hypothetical protein
MKKKKVLNAVLIAVLLCPVLQASRVTEIGFGVAEIGLGLYLFPTGLGLGYMGRLRAMPDQGHPENGPIKGKPILNKLCCSSLFVAVTAVCWVPGYKLCASGLKDVLGKNRTQKEEEQKVDDLFEGLRKNHSQAERLEVTKKTEETLAAIRELEDVSHEQSVSGAPK